MESFYERHMLEKADLPLIYHHDFQVGKSFTAHWHENVELLYVTQGTGMLYDNLVRVPMQTGELIVVNSGHIHTVESEEGCRYDCLIADKSFCAALGILVEELRFATRVADEAIGALFRRLAAEMEDRRPFYTAAVKALVIDIFVRLCRDWLQANPGGAGQKSAMVKDAISLINQRYGEPLTVDAISASVGFSRYYFCRVFKAYTGRTVLEYLNYVRCAEAWELLASGEYNVGESAALCGIPNLSHFSRTFRKYMGVYPSAVRPGARAALSRSASSSAR